MLLSTLASRLSYAAFRWRSGCVSTAVGSSRRPAGPKNCSAWAAKCVPNVVSSEVRAASSSWRVTGSSGGRGKPANLAVAAGQRHRERPVAAVAGGRSRGRSSGSAAADLPPSEAELHLADVPRAGGCGARDPKVRESMLAIRGSGLDRQCALSSANCPTIPNARTLLPTSRAADFDVGFHRA